MAQNRRNPWVWLSPPAPCYMCYMYYMDAKPLNLHSPPGPCYMCYMCHMGLTRQAAEPPLSPSSMLYVLSSTETVARGKLPWQVVWQPWWPATWVWTSSSWCLRDERPLLLDELQISSSNSGSSRCRTWRNSTTTWTTWRRFALRTSCSKGLSGALARLTRSLTRTRAWC